VTIAGQLFAHLLFQFVLSFSKWRFVGLAFSETFEALVRGIQDALWEMKGVPLIWRSDNLSAATHQIPGGGRELNRRFKDVLDHYGAKSTRIEPGGSHQNGVVEKGNDVLKSSLVQALLIRGSREFASVAKYMEFVGEIRDRLNEKGAARFAEEQEHLRPLPATRSPAYTKYTATVRQWSTIHFAHRVYSVPSRLIGCEVEIRQHPDVIEVFFRDRTKPTATMPRIRGDRYHQIDYRHVIWSLVRKPGAFARYRFREELFPSVVFRRTYDALLMLAASAPTNFASRSEPDAGRCRACTRDAARSRRAVRLQRGEGCRRAGEAARSAYRHSATRPPDLRPPSRGRCAMSDLTTQMQERMSELLTRFKLPSVAAEVARRFAAAGHDDALATLLEVLEAEADERGQRKTERLLRASRLPPGKTLESLDRARLPRQVVAKLDELATGDFIERAQNVLCFGLPGRGKTHAAAALGHALVQRGHSVLFSPTFRLVQELLAAKRELALPRALPRLDAYDVLICDDIGYVQQSADEVEVLFTLMAERYERRSLVITSNLVFAEWDRIFKNPMTTAAAIDRLVHHSVILEFSGRSKRADEAESRSKPATVDAAE
jgi:DNA replication protein DnaC